MNKKILLLLFYLVPLLGFSQPDSTRQIENDKGHVYIETGAGISSSLFRDKATSPLFYQGVAVAGFLSRIKKSERVESDLSLRLILGSFGAEVNERKVGSANFNSLSLQYGRLYQISGWSGQKWDFRAGGLLVATVNGRINEDLQNNSFGFEGFLNLMGVAKAARDVSRREEKEKKFWFIEYTLKPRKRFLSYELNMGLLNNYLRNGYAYIDQAGLLNEGYSIWENYDVSTFSGIRFGSELNYTLYLTGARNNAVRISYVWDAVQTKAGPDAFAMSFHIIRFSLLYNTK